MTASADRVLSDVYLSQLNVPLKMYPTHPFEKKNISVANLTNLVKIMKALNLYSGYSAYLHSYLGWIHP